jgi:hypothetical protein
LPVSVHPHWRFGSDLITELRALPRMLIFSLNDIVMIDEIIEEVKKQGGSLD